MKRTVLIIAFAAVSLMIWAQAPRRVPATPHPIDLVQPNGDTLTIRLHGDEWSHYRTTLDGYLILENKKGYYCYAWYTHKGVIEPTKWVAHNEADRSRKEKKFVKNNVPQRGVAAESEAGTNHRRR